MSREVEDFNRRLLRARDAMDRAYAEPLAIGSVAAELAREGAITRDQVVLHLSGLLDRNALLPLEGTPDMSSTTALA